jgi:hypothetical protein
MTWACEWLVRVRRATAPGAQRGSILIGDASSPPLDPMRPYTMALELLCLRAGLSTLTIPLCATVRLSEAVSAVEPDAIVIAGSRELSRHLLRWVTDVRAVSGPVPVLLYHYDDDGPSNGRSNVPTLSRSPLAARTEIVAALAADARPEDDEQVAAAPISYCA